MLLAMQEQMKVMQQSFADALQRQSTEIKSLTEEIVMIKSKSTPPQIMLTPPGTEKSTPIQTSNESGDGSNPAKNPNSSSMEPSIPPQGGDRRSARINDPTKFEGKRKDLLRFLQQLELKLEGNADWYPTERSRLIYAWGLLDGDAADLMRNVQPKDLEHLVSILEASYGDPHRETTARRKLQQLRQGRKGFISFFAEFQRYANDSGWNARALVDQLLVALNDDLRAALVGVKIPSSLEEAANVINECQNDLLRLQITVEPRRTRNNQRRDPDAMDLDTIYKKHNEPNRNHRHSQSRERLMKEGKCFNCGGKGHLARNCPSPEKGSVNALDHQETRNLSQSPRRTNSRGRRRRRNSSSSRSPWRPSSNKSTNSSRSPKEKSRD
jgi:hypothetical protein